MPAITARDGLDVPHVRVRRAPSPRPSGDIGSVGRANETARRINCLAYCLFAATRLKQQQQHRHRQRLRIQLALAGLMPYPQLKRDRGALTISNGLEMILESQFAPRVVNLTLVAS